MKNNIATKWAVGFCIFTALSALSFKFSTSSASTTFLVETSGSWIIRLLSVGALIAALIFRQRFSKNELFGLSALYASVPFAFYINQASAQAHATFWQKDLLVSLCFWLIAAILLSRFLVSAKAPTQ
ncbi:hypothetical protein BKI52_43730 [marine bacterium AO1-C]|nr:hypothetical protein BKI52_43730 [marine bacterium AO1-C]